MVLYTDDQFTQVLSGLTVVCSIFMYITGIDVILKVRQRKSTTGNSVYPFLLCAITSTFSLKYGLLLHDSTMIFVNAFGAILEAIYTAIFYLYSHQKSKLISQMTFFVCLMLLILSFTKYGFDDHSNELQFQGFVCCISNLLNYSAPLLDTAVSVKQRSKENLSLKLITIYLIVSTEWFMYGLILDNIYLKIPNFVGILVGTFQVSLYFYFSRKERESLLPKP